MGCKKPRGQQDSSVETFETGPKNNRTTREVIITRKGGVPSSRQESFGIDTATYAVCPHNHTDIWANHGMKIPECAEAYTEFNREYRRNNSPLVPIITNHTEADPNGAMKIEELMKETREDIEVGVGVELNLRFMDRKFHVNVLFKDKSNIPYTPPEGVNPRERRINIDELRELKENEDIVVILNHPFWQAKTQYIDQSYEIVMALLNTGLIDGYEIINGAYLQNFTKRKSHEKLLKMEVTNRLLKIIYTIKCYADFRSQNPKKLLAAIGASDSHRGEYVGSSYTVLERISDNIIDDFFEAVENGDTNAVVDDIKSSLIIIRCIKILNRKFQRILNNCITTGELDYKAFQRLANADKNPEKNKVQRKTKAKYKRGPTRKRRRRR